MQQAQPQQCTAEAEAAIAKGVFGYRQIVARCVEALGRPLLKPEKTAVTRAIHGRHDSGGLVSRQRKLNQDPGPEPPPRVLVFTGFSLNYTVGHLCSAVNRAYAARHGYGWRCDAIPLEQMSSLLGGAFGSWYKVLMINRLLEECQFDSSGECYSHIMWIDADAVVVDHSKKVEELIELAGRHTELIVAEDMTPCCLLNAGVLIIRCSPWSRALWSDLWSQKWTMKYRDTPFYEQSALIRWLQSHGERLQDASVSASASTAARAEATHVEEDVVAKDENAREQGGAPFHSYRGGPTVKRTAHLCIVSHEMLNTNQHSGVANAEPATTACARSIGNAVSSADPEPEPESDPGSDCCIGRAKPAGPRYIFHAVGLPKLTALCTALHDASTLSPLRMLLSRDNAALGEVVASRNPGNAVQYADTTSPAKTAATVGDAVERHDALWERRYHWSMLLDEMFLLNPRYILKSGVLLDQTTGTTTTDIATAIDGGTDSTGMDSTEMEDSVRAVASSATRRLSCRKLAAMLQVRNERFEAAYASANGNASTAAVDNHSNSNGGSAKPPMEATLNFWTTVRYDWTWLQMLDLSSNGLGDADITALVAGKGLSRCITLRSISLAHNAFSHCGLSTLTNALLELHTAQLEWALTCGAAAQVQYPNGWCDDAGSRPLICNADAQNKTPARTSPEMHLSALNLVGAFASSVEPKPTSTTCTSKDGAMCTVSRCVDAVLPLLRPRETSDKFTVSSEGHFQQFQAPGLQYLGLSGNGIGMIDATRLRAAATVGVGCNVILDGALEGLDQGGEKATRELTGAARDKHRAATF